MNNIFQKVLQFPLFMYFRKIVALITAASPAPCVHLNKGCLLTYTKQIHYQALQ